MMRRFVIIALVASLALVSCTESQSLRPWKKGTLDIHCINTGRGESMFYVFPDGTTMLVDAAGSLLKKHKHMPTEPKPDSTMSSGQAIINYIRHFAPKGHADSIDYFLLSHYHTDHMGDAKKFLPIHPEGKFLLSSICEVGSTIPYKRLITRGDPTEVKSSNCAREESISNFARFVNWSVKANGTKYEFFDPCSDTQIVPVRGKVKDFKVHNLAANGRFRTAPDSDEWTTNMPPKAVLDSLGDPKAYPGENALSTVFILSYGPFDIFAGGDLQWAHRDLHDYFDMEAPVSGLCHKVEVMKASHHCTKGANGPEIMNVLRPDAVVAHVWRDVQPNPETLDNIYAANPDCKVFLTNLHKDNIVRDYLDRFASTSGHIVIRVANGGKTYTIYTLDDTDPSYRITGIWGPFSATDGRVSPVAVASRPLPLRGPLPLTEPRVATGTGDTRPLVASNNI
ncbi:MAG: hypothetical protein J6O51_10035 [Bacteroidales bacterium]|nr:hypothetical protein [Bacteroidales bacterium]